MDPLSLISGVNQDLIIMAGDTLAFDLQFLADDGTTPIDISSLTFKMSIKPIGKPLSPSLLDFTLGAGLTIGGTGNSVLSLSKKITMKGGQYIYDLQATDGSGKVTTYMYGAINGIQDVTDSTTET